MKCPKCRAPDTKVLDSRPIEDGLCIRRRRECLNCGFRFTTYERFFTELFVVKKDGRREPFSREKLLIGLRKACHKRPISEEQIQRFLNELEAELILSGESEIPSHYIGERIMNFLKNTDKVAYIRFASVYKDFKDLDEFLAQIEKLKEGASESQG